MRNNYLFLGDSLENLKLEIRGEKKAIFRRLYELARVYKEQNLPEEHPEKSITFMGMAIFNLSLLYLLTKQKHYLDEAKRWIFTAVKYPHWGNAFLVDVDLSAAFLLFGLSISYDWLKDDLTEEEEVLLREKVCLQATRMYDFKVKTQGQGWSTAYFQNHNWINMTGLAAAGYALKGQWELADEVVESAKDNFSKVYEYMPEDGSDYEGVVYWRYGVIWLYIYGHLLKTQEGINHFETCSFLEQTFYYRLYQAMPNLEEIANFGDCHDKKSGHSTAIYAKIAAEYKDEYAQQLGDVVRDNFIYREYYESKVKPGILPETGLELIWYDPGVTSKSFETLPLVKYFEDLGLVVLRSDFEEEAFHFSFKCGVPGGKKQFKKSFEIEREVGYKTRGLSHQHPDNNSFILHANDTYHAIDEGYNRTVKAREHNVITVDGKGYRNEGQNNIWHELTEDITAEISNFISEDGMTYFKGSANNMYVDELQLTQYDRHVLYLGGHHIMMIDELASDLEHQYTYHLHTETKPLMEDGNVFEYENGPGKMKFYIASDVAIQNELTNTYVKAIMTTQEPDVFREVDMDTLRVFNQEKTKEVAFISLLCTADSFLGEFPEVKKINQRSLQGYEIETCDGKELVLYAKEGISYEGIQTDAKILLVKESAQEIQYLVVDGSKVEVNGRKVLDVEQKVTTIVRS